MAKTRPRYGSPLRVSSAFELFPQSYEIIKRHFNVFTVLFSASGLLALWDTLGRYVDDSTGGWKEVILSKSLGININAGKFYDSGFVGVIGLLALLAYLFIVVAVLRASQHRAISLGSILEELREGWLWIKMIGALLLLGLVIVLGLFALIIPGIILIWRLYFVLYILVDKRVGIIDAFKQSWNMTRGYAGAVYGVILVTILLSLGNIVPIFGPLVAFVLTSIYMVAPALRYQELKRVSQHSSGG